MSLPEELDIVVNITFTMLPSVDPSMESNSTTNDTGSHNNTSQHYYFYMLWTVRFAFILPLSVFGMVGNGIIIWILGFRVKRNPFTTYILNLSIADFAFLATQAFECTYSYLIFLRYAYSIGLLWKLLLNLILFTFGTSQFLLAAISMDRCVCLFFPIWQKCHRPPHFSTIVCVTIWSLTFSMSAVSFVLALSIAYGQLWYYLYFLNAVLCLPAMAVSTISMLIKFCFMSPHHKRGKFLKAVLLALLFFLLFGFPPNASQLLIWHRIRTSPYFHMVAVIGAALNSAVNPIIYYLIGRQKKAQSKQRITKILEKFFQEEEEGTSPKEDVQCPLKQSL